MKFDPDAQKDYSDAVTVMRIEPHNMYVYASRMKTVLGEIYESWGTIAETWKGLELGWTGESEEAAQAFQARLQAVQKDVFGYEDADGTRHAGVLGQVRGAAVHASVLYGNAEDRVGTMFERFLEALEAEGGGEPQPPTSTDKGPITVKYGNGPNVVRYEA